MVLQELGLHFHYQPGKANLDAAALSRNALPNDGTDVAMPWTVLAP